MVLDIKKIATNVITFYVILFFTTVGNAWLTLSKTKDRHTATDQQRDMLVITQSFADIGKVISENTLAMNNFVNIYTQSITNDGEYKGIMKTSMQQLIKLAEQQNGHLIALKGRYSFTGKVSNTGSHTKIR